MWTDLLYLHINGWHVAAGVCFLIAGLIALVWMIVEWGGVTLGPDPAPPPVQHIRGHWRREDSDTAVIPFIPGATREVAEFVDAVDRDAEVLRVIATEPTPTVPRERTEEPGGLLAGLPAAPVCSVCGGPVGNCTCYVKAECPLTTQELPKLDEALPEYETTVRRTATRDLSALMEKVKQA